MNAEKTDFFLDVSFVQISEASKIALYVNIRPDPSERSEK